MNAMALIAPGAFLWLTYAQQCLYGQPMAGAAMWFGIVVALLLCLATAISYAELSKLYPGAGSSYFFAEQAFLSKNKAFKYARIAKFAVGWASHLYYWVYPGVMVGVTALLMGYLLGQLFPTVFNSAVPSPVFMILFSIVFPFLVGYIAYRRCDGCDLREHRDQRYPDHRTGSLFRDRHCLSGEPRDGRIQRNYAQSRWRTCFQSHRDDDDEG